ncbi:MAG: GAF domain-containing protein, partial [Chloroflexi bacterium]|nr:GAF domain-containing protein [Chloroflexota bacterium]
MRPPLIDCRLAEQRLLAYLEHELTPIEMEEVERHLSACPNCFAHFELEAKLRRLQRRRVDPPTSSGAGVPAPGRSLLRRFTLISFTLTLLATTVAVFAMGRLVETYLLGQVALESRGRLDHTILPLLQDGPSDTLADPANSERLDAIVRNRLLIGAVERAAIWDRMGRRVYESAPTDAGVAPELVAATLAHGERHDVFPGPQGRRLRFLMPIVSGGAVVGVYEVDENFEPLAAHVLDMQSFMAVSLVGFSIVLYLLLFRLVRQAARDLDAEITANSRLIAAERRQSERLGVAAELARLLTKSLDLEAIVRATLQEVRRLVQYRHASVVLVEPDGSAAVWALAADGTLQPEAAMCNLAASRPGEAMATAGPVVDVDVGAHPRFAEDRALAEAHGVRSVLAMPLISRGRPLGTLNLGHEEAGTYSAADVSVLQPVAESLAAAVENGRLYGEAQRAGTVASALLRTAETLARLVPLDQLLEEVAMRAVELLEADDALIFLAEGDGQRFVLRAGAGVPEEKLARFPIQTVSPATFTAFAALCTTNEPLAIADARHSPLVPPGLAEWWGVISCLFVPIVHGERIQGAMVVHFTQVAHHFTAAELRLASGLAGQTAVAIANSHAFETVRGSETRFRLLVQNASDIITILEANGCYSTHILAAPGSITWPSSRPHEGKTSHEGRFQEGSGSINWPR